MKKTDSKNTGKSGGGPKMTAGAGGGKGRLEKAAIQKKKR